MLERRSDFQAIAMPDGRVLVSGGSMEKASSEWFDPTQRKFIPGPVMTQMRQGHRALLHSSGRVLILGGTEKGTPVEILEPGAARFTAVPGDARFSLAADALELADGRVLLVDGLSGKTYTWEQQKGIRSASLLSRPRIFSRMTQLPTGRVLLSGGWDPTKDVNTKGLPIESFNPKWGTWSAWRSDTQPRARHSAGLTPDGKVCLWGGYGRDASGSADSVEILDPVKETCSVTGKVSLGALPAWAPLDGGKGLLLPDGGNAILQNVDPAQLPDRAQAGIRLANAYLSPQLVPLKKGGWLVLGSPVWGASMERWDPKLRQSLLVGSLRPGTERLVSLKDGRILAVGAVVDQLDPRTGVLTPLGWKDDLLPLLNTIPVASKEPAPGLPPFMGESTRKDYLLVGLSKGKFLLAGGTTGDGKPSRILEQWEPAKKQLVPGGTLKSARTFPSNADPQGGLLLKDGSVLIYGRSEE